MACQPILAPRRQGGAAMVRRCYTPKHHLSPGLPDLDIGLGQEEPLALRTSSPPPKHRSQYRSLGLLLSHINSTAPNAVERALRNAAALIQQH